MSILRLIYLTLAIAGTIVPMRQFLLWSVDNAFSIQNLIAAWNTNFAATGLYYDMVITATALVIWIIAEVYVRRDYWVALICIPAIFAIGVSCAFPLYLFLRTRPIK